MTQPQDSPRPAATAGSPDDVLPGVLVGHDTDQRRPTGVTVVLLPEGTIAGVDVRGAAPGTRETDLLDPVNTIEEAHAFVLAGGSAFGLAAADGVMGWLAERGRGVPVGPAVVPIVPGAVLFDLLVGDPSVRPDAAAGRRACDAAVALARATTGSVGAGAGATVGKLLGPDRAMRGGLGIAVVAAGGITMAAVIAVNAVGDIVDPGSGSLLAGARQAPDSLELADAVRTWLAMAPPSGAAPSGAAPSGGAPSGAAPSGGAPAGGATTIGALVTDARLTKAQATRLAQVAHDGLARTIRPVHTPLDGDTLFVAGTGTAANDARGGPDMLLLSMLAAEAAAVAVLAGVRAAAPGLRIDGQWLPAWADLR